jgi:hypothetical protein
VTDNNKENIMSDAPKPLSRSEKEAKIKDKAGLVINFFALLLAINTFIGGSLSSTIMNNTIKANDVWNFYQAKSIKQTEYEIAAEQTKNPALAKEWTEKAASYEDGKEGKKELYTTAKKLEADRDAAKKSSPWISYASTAFQLSIVLLSASILAVSMYLFWGSFVAAGIGLVLMSEGLWMWF